MRNITYSKSIWIWGDFLKNSYVGGKNKAIFRIMSTLLYKIESISRDYDKSQLMDYEREKFNDELIELKVQYKSLEY